MKVVIYVAFLLLVSCKIKHTDNSDVSFRFALLVDSGKIFINPNNQPNTQVLREVWVLNNLDNAIFIRVELSGMESCFSVWLFEFPGDRLNYKAMEWYMYTVERWSPSKFQQINSHDSVKIFSKNHVSHYDSTLFILSYCLDTLQPGMLKVEKKFSKTSFNHTIKGP